MSKPNYIPRHIEPHLPKLASMFGALIVTGPRQAGKTTLLKHAAPHLPLISLDDELDRRRARLDPKAFLQANTPPVIIDEVQYAGELFPAMKIAIDADRSQKGLFWLSGSQQYSLMEKVTESLAGRIGIANLLPLSLREIALQKRRPPFLSIQEQLASNVGYATPLNHEQLWHHIWRGSYPEVALDANMGWREFYGSYLSSYLQRDVRKLSQVGDLSLFTAFMTAIAARTASVLNLSAVSRELGISAPTAKRWLGILEASGIVFVLRPYFSNLNKRLTKSPKIHFLDTGLACYLTEWRTPESLSQGAFRGAIFESFAFSEILKSYYNDGELNPPLYYYRDAKQNEIDLLIKQADTIHPIEIKTNATPASSDFKAFSLLDDIAGVKRGEGAVVCANDRVQEIGDCVYTVPVWSI